MTLLSQMNNSYAICTWLPMLKWRWPSQGWHIQKRKEWVIPGLLNYMSVLLVCLLQTFAMWWNDSTCWLADYWDAAQTTTKTLTQCWFDFRPPSTTLAQHQTSIGLTARVCRDVSDRSVLRGIRWLATFPGKHPRNEYQARHHTGVWHG